MQTTTGFIGQANQVRLIENETMDSIDLPAKYKVALPQNLDIFNTVESALGKIEDRQMKSNIEDFIIKFKACLSQLKNIDNNLSKLNISFMDDGSVVIEWIYNYFRIGFAFEKNEEESSYYVVIEDQEGTLITKTGLLKKDETIELIPELINFVLENT